MSGTNVRGSGGDAGSPWPSRGGPPAFSAVRNRSGSSPGGAVRPRQEFRFRETAGDLARAVHVTRA